MKAADSRHLQKLTLLTLARLDLPVRRRLFPQAVMGPVLMIVREEFSADSSQILFVERDHMIQQLRRQLPTQRSAIPFCQGL
jgi:hypothetical protein